MKTNKILYILIIPFILLYGCNNDESQDSNPPGVLTIQSISPTNGGGIISYILPEDSDILNNQLWSI